MTTIDVFQLIKRATKAERINDELLDKLAEVEARVEELEEELDLTKEAAINAVSEASHRETCMGLSECQSLLDEEIGLERVRRWNI